MEGGTYSAVSLHSHVGNTFDEGGSGVVDAVKHRLDIRS